MKILHALVLIIFISIPYSAQGALLFTEVMYDPQGTDSDREWVEVQNTGADSVNITGWKFGDVDSPNHTIYPPSDESNPGQGSMSIPAGSFAILASNATQFLAEYPGFSGIVLDTVMSLRNTQGTLTLRTESDGNAVSAVTYNSDLGAKNDGGSLQRTSEGTWTPTVPSPGAGYGQPIPYQQAVTPTPTPTPVTQTTIGGPPANDTKETKKEQEKPPAVLSMRAVLEAPASAIAGIPVEITPAVFGTLGELRFQGVFRYAFGDGTKHESRNKDTIRHTFQTEGTYVITLSYRSHAYIEKNEVVAKHTIRVGAPNVAISSIKPNGSIELSNSLTIDVDISNWKLVTVPSSSVEPVQIPEGTVILSGATLPLDPSVTVSLVTGKAVALTLPSGIIVSLYEPHAITQVVSSTPVVVSKIAPTTKSVSQEVLGSVASSDKESVLQASVLSALPSEEPLRQTGRSGTSRPLWVFIVGLAGVIGVAIWALRAISHKAVSQVLSKESSMSETEAVARSIRIIEEE